MTERLACKTPGCASMILASTAEKTGGYCMPCANHSRQEERARFIAANRVNVDRFAGLTDVVEVLRRMHEPPAYDPLVNLLPFERTMADVYRALGQRDADRLVAIAAPTQELLQDVAAHLASFARVDLRVCQEALLDQGQTRPSHAFRDASDPIVERLFALLGQGGRAGPLRALAWSRHPRFVEALRAWANHPPPWQDRVPPHAYSTYAGWELERGAVRSLTMTETLGIVATEGDATLTLFAVDRAGPPCPRCHRAAVSLLRLHDEERPPGSIPTCLECACYRPTWVRFAPDGAWEWLDRDAAEARHMDPWGLTPIRAALTPRPPWETVQWTIADAISQIGGLPSWVAHPFYPTCPVCSRTTLVIAQVGVEDFVAADGIFYAHQCADCSVLGVSYQQT